jgi:hypothetical protein
MTNMGGSRDEGGYKASFKVFQDVPITENAVVVIFSDDWYGNTRVSFGGNFPNAEKIFFVGYVMEGSISYNSQYSYVEFTAGSLSELMKTALGFSVSVESKESPAKWYELLDMDCRRAIYHYLKWHTTALSIADFQFVGEDRNIQFFDADRNSMFDAIDNLMRNTLIGKSVSDRQGKMWMEVDAKAYSNPTGSFSSAMEIAKRDWMGQPSIEERQSDQLSYLEYGGIAYSGVVTGTFSAILASAPGNAPSFRGSIETHEGLALLGQDQLNQLVGNVWANENADYPKINMDMGVSLRNLDIAPQETNQIRILPSDTVRNLEINGLYVPSGMDWNYNPSSQLLLPSVEFTALVSGARGETITIADNLQIDNGFAVPGLQIPPLPLLTIPPSLADAISSAVSSATTPTVAYANVGWHNNISTNVRTSGITVVTFTRSNGTAEIILDGAPQGTYLVIGVASNAGAGLTAGNVYSGAMFLNKNGNAIAIANPTTVANSIGSAGIAATAMTITQLSALDLIEMEWGGGLGGFNAPTEAALMLVKIA